MKKNTLKILGWVFMISVMFAGPAFGQGNVAVLFDGAVLTGSPNFFGKSAMDVADLNEMKPKQTVFPGVEVRFFNQGRVSLGVGWQKWQLESDSRHIELARPDGVWAASWDESSDASANVFTGTVYLNVLTHGRVRPFVGLGGGYAPFDVRHSIINYKINSALSNTGFTPPSEIIKTGTSARAIVRGVAGLNLYPVRHTMITIAGGYMNGPVVSMGAGFTF